MSSSSGVSMTTDREHQGYYVTKKHNVWQEIIILRETSHNMS